MHMTTCKIVAAISPFTLAMLAEVGIPGSGLIQTIVQGGALGLCAVLVLWLCYSFSKVLADHKKERMELVQVIQDQIRRDQINSQMVNQALNRVASTLHERPCLVKCGAFNLDNADNITKLEPNQE
jgi:threonine dehydrogenase-like Zn-dependent dehydrogenase